MIEISDDIWSVTADAKCITTNSIVKNDGRLVMGAGLAKQAADKLPWLPWSLGHGVTTNGNHVHCVDARSELGCYIVSFPTKNDWRDPSSLALIERSADELSRMARAFCWKIVILPRVGCGLGKLSWNDVRPVLNERLNDDMFIVVGMCEDKR